MQSGKKTSKPPTTHHQASTFSPLKPTGNWNQHGRAWMKTFEQNGVPQPSFNPAGNRQQRAITTTNAQQATSALAQVINLPIPSAGHGRNEAMFHPRMLNSPMHATFAQYQNHRCCRCARQDNQDQQRRLVAAGVCVVLIVLAGLKLYFELKGGFM